MFIFLACFRSIGTIIWLLLDSDVGGIVIVGFRHNGCSAVVSVTHWMYGAKVESGGAFVLPTSKTVIYQKDPVIVVRLSRRLEQST
jgi:hypothetical protein